MSLYFQFNGCSSLGVDGQPSAASCYLDQKKTLKEKEIHFTWDETLLNYLVKKSYSATYGARNLRRLIQKELEDAIAVRLIEGYQNPVSQLKAVSDGEKLELLAM